MTYANCLRAIACVLGMVLAAGAVAQENKCADDPADAQASPDFSGGTADEWMKVLFESNVDEFLIRVVDRLSYFHLSSDQVRQLKEAADQEKSDSKRVVLWQAIRQSRDIDGRSYLIQTLLNKTSKEVQIQFIEQLPNPTRFDVPILVALYNSHRPPQEASKRPLDTEPRAIAPEVFDVPLAIVEFTCHARWSDSTSAPGCPFPYASNAPVELRAKYQALTSKRRDEAKLAQVEMVHWLIKNGFEDSHRLLAYQAFLLVQPETNSANSRHSDFAHELLKGLEKPESRAKAVQTLRPIDPSQYLDDEAEIVRLSALDVMGKHLIQSRAATSVQTFLGKAELYKPILERVQRTDSSPEVKTSAKRLQETIAAFEKQDAKLAKP